MKNLRINAKIMVMNGALLALFITSLLYLSFKIGKGTDIIEDQGQTLSYLERVEAASKNFYKMQYWLSDLAVSWLNESEDHAETAQAELDSALVDIVQLAQTESDQDSVLVNVEEVAQTISAQVEAYYSLSLEAVDAYIDENRVLGNSLTADAHRTAKEIDEELEALLTASQTKTREAGEIVIRNNKNVRNTSFFLMVLVTALGAVFAWFFAKSIVRPIILLRDAAQKVSEGDLTQRVARESLDETGQLTDVFNEMVANMENSSEVLRAEKVNAETENLKAEEAVRELEAQKQYLSSSVDRMLREMGRFAQGDLTVHLEAERDDEIGQLYAGFNRAVSNIRSLFEQIRQAVVSAVSAATQISSATEELSAGAQEQSIQAGEVAAAVEEMARTIVENAQNATRTAEVAQKNGQVAREGGQVVGQTVEKIREIAEVADQSAQTVERLGVSSRQIGEIVGVINEIADQTNLLALNAAIEAARAGEQGRGFAVVADEVRKLAERTTQATKQIGDMIKTIQFEASEAVQAMQRGNEEVRVGIGLADQAGEALQQIVTETQNTVDLINQIAAASEEQSTTSEEISRSVESITTVTEESAQGLSEIARSSDALNQLMDDLRGLVAQFKLGDRVDRPATPREQKHRLDTSGRLPHQRESVR